jgi:hypothetical protein
MSRLALSRGLVALWAGGLFAVAGGCGTTTRDQPPTVSPALLGADIPPGAIGIDLANETAFTIDPLIWVGGYPLGLRTLAPLEGFGEGTAYDVDCFSGDELVIDPALLLEDGDQVLPVNGPVVLQEGVDYFCGDLISVYPRLDEEGTYFVAVSVNDFFVAF